MCPEGDTKRKEVVIHAATFHRSAHIHSKYGRGDDMNLQLKRDNTFLLDVVFSVFE